MKKDIERLYTSCYKIKIVTMKLNSSNRRSHTNCIFYNIAAQNKYLLFSVVLQMVVHHLFKSNNETLCMWTLQWQNFFFSIANAYTSNVTTSSVSFFTAMISDLKLIGLFCNTAYVSCSTITNSSTFNKCFLLHFVGFSQR